VNWKYENKTKLMGFYSLCLQIDLAVIHSILTKIDKKINVLPYHSRINIITPWPESPSEHYRPRHRRLSAKLLPTIKDRGVSCSQIDGSPTAVISIF
jgi:hypothetical protein